MKNQNRPRFSFMLLMGCLLLSFAQEKPLAKPESVCLAVAKFENLTGDKKLKNLEEVIPNFLLTELSLDKRIRVVERKRLKKILEEQKLALTGLLEKETVETIGHVLNADFLVLGSISLSGGNLRIDVHLLDTKTAQIVFATKAYGSDRSHLDVVCEFIAKKIISELFEETSPKPPDIIKGKKTLNLDVELNNKYFIPKKYNTVYLRTTLTTGKKETTQKRLPLNIALVIDKSGSMASENKLEFVKRAANFAIDNLTDKDFISIVTYDTQVYVPVPAEKVSNKDKIKNVISRLRPGSSTNLSGGMKEGYSQVLKNYSNDYINRVILLSDGLANVGETRTDVLQEVAKNYADEGANLTSMGVGTQYNEQLMLALAEYGGGNYYFIDTPEKTLEIFSREFKGLLNIVAKKIFLEIVPEKGIEITRVYGYKFRRDGKNVYLSLSNMFESETRNIITELLINKKGSGKIALAEVNVSYESVAKPDVSLKETKSIEITSVKNEKKYKTGKNPDVQEEVELAVSAESLLRVSKLLSEGKNTEAKDLLSKQVNRIINSSVDLKNPKLQENAVVLMQNFSQIEIMTDKEKREERTKALSVATPAVRRFEMKKMKAAPKMVQEAGYAQRMGGGRARQSVAEVDKQKLNEYLKQGSVYYQNGKTQEAINEWGKVLVIDPDNQIIKSYIKKAQKKLK